MEDDLALPEVVSTCEPDNIASWKVMERLGMIRDRETVHPSLGVPLYVYATDRRRWRANLESARPEPEAPRDQLDRSVRLDGDWG